MQLHVVRMLFITLLHCAVGLLMKINRSVDHSLLVKRASVLWHLLCSLSGLSPFMGDTDTDTMSNVTRGRFEFHSPEFDDISDDAKDLIANLLQADQRHEIHNTNRYTT